MVAAGAYHTVLLKSDGSAVAVGDERPGFPGKYCQIPPLSPGESYVQVAAGFGHTVLLKNDGTVVACGFDNEGQCRIPALESGVVYTQVAAGHKHTVLLTSHGDAVAFGCDDYGQCQIPSRKAGIHYTQCAAGKVHTVLLTSDGSAVAVGGWCSRRLCQVEGRLPWDACRDQVKIPQLEAGVSYTRVAAGDFHTVLIKSDGTAVAVGDACAVWSKERCRIPALQSGLTYTYAAAGIYHTVLLRSDGTAVVIGGAAGEFVMPELPGGVRYMQAAAGHSHTVFLKSDGTAAAFGNDAFKQCQIPALDAGITYCVAAPLPRRIYQAQCKLRDEEIDVRLVELSGNEYCRFTVPITGSMVALQNRSNVALGMLIGEIVLPDGKLLRQGILENPAGTLQQLLFPSKRRRFN